VPLPNSPDGYFWGNPTAPVVVDVYLDLLCPDSAALWPTFLQVLQYYGPTQIQGVLHTFPLPYHTWAFVVNQGAQVIKSINGTDAAVYDYVRGTVRGGAEGGLGSTFG
jgi:protein-disulfide isomerase